MSLGHYRYGRFFTTTVTSIQYPLRKNISDSHKYNSENKNKLHELESRMPCISQNEMALREKDVRLLSLPEQPGLFGSRMP